MNDDYDGPSPFLQPQIRASLQYRPDNKTPIIHAPGNRNPNNGISIRSVSPPPFVRPSISPSVHPVRHPSVYPSIIHPSIYPSVYLSVRPSIRFSVRPSTPILCSPNQFLSVCPSIRPSQFNHSVCLSILLSVHPLF